MLLTDEAETSLAVGSMHLVQLSSGEWQIQMDSTPQRSSTPQGSVNEKRLELQVDSLQRELAFAQVSKQAGDRMGS